MDDRYETVYNVTLLDDLHNYFPEVLYNPDRFRSVSELLNYIRNNTSRRFNLFEYGNRQYLQQHTIPRNTFVQDSPVVNTWVPPPPRVEIEETAEYSFLLPILRTLVQPQRINRGTRSALFEDIIINASEELINNVTSSRTLEQDLEGSCSICQDRMVREENIRKLNSCQHEFHVECIDNWLLNNSVLCPVCRHDIREPSQSIRPPLLQPNETQIPPIPEDTRSRRRD